MNEKEQAYLKIKENCENLFESNKNLILEFATGVGKTFNAINLQKKINSQKTLVLVSENLHKKNWIEEYEKHGFSDLLESTRIACYASLKDYSGVKCDLLILDEMHHAFTEIRSDLISKIRPKRVIGLSATITEEDISLFNSLFEKSTVFSISMKEAISLKVLPEPSIKIIYLDLDDTEQKYSIEFNRGNKKHKLQVTCDYLQRNAYIYNSKKYPNIELSVRCTAKQKYQYLDVIYNTYKKLYYKNKSMKSKWLKSGLDRKKFLSEYKTEKVKELCSILVDKKRFICFCGSVEQASYLGGYKAISSKNKNSQEVVGMFNSGMIDSIYAMNMAREGINLNDIDAAIISQLDGNERQFIQKVGRAMRSKAPTVYVFCVKESNDMKYLSEALADIPSEYIEENYTIPSWNSI